MYWIILLDIDLNDPEVEAAAAKIQSAFKNRKGFGKKQELFPWSPSEEMFFSSKCLVLQISNVRKYDIYVVSLQIRDTVPFALKCRLFLDFQKKLTKQKKQF